MINAPLLFLKLIRFLFVTLNLNASLNANSLGQKYFCHMKNTFTYTFILLFSSTLSIAQARSKSNPVKPSTIVNKNKGNSNNKNITGIWKGHFLQNGFGIGEDRYRFEVQIGDMDKHELKAVTYSYKTTVFYGKAEAIGIFTSNTNNVIIKETKLVDVKIADQSSGACLMTCYLDYDKIGKNETLTGTYTSVMMKDKSDCGSGKIFLEKNPVSDFYKEDFVVKRENELKKKDKPILKKAPVVATVPKKPEVRKPQIKPGAEGNLQTSRQQIKDSATVVLPKKEKITIPTPPVIKILPKPEVIKNRENEIIKTITTSEKEFKIDLYDNGEVDGDRISVYHNNSLIVSNKELSGKPITFIIKADEGAPMHEFVMVAENLGSIPPNTSLMIITAGEQRYELFVTSTEKKNAVVRIEYQAK